MVGWQGEAEATAWRLKCSQLEARNKTLEEVVQLKSAENAQVHAVCDELLSHLAAGTGAAPSSPGEEEESEY